MNKILCCGLSLVCLALTGCVSFYAIEQERVDQGKLLLNGENDPNAPKKIRKIIGVDIEVPHAGKPATTGDPIVGEPEREYQVLPMKGLQDASHD